MTPRDYQTEDQLKIKQHWDQLERRLLLVWATGLGKTKLFSTIYNVIPKRKKMVVLVNREELVRQTAETLREENPGFFVGIEQAENRHSPFDDAVVASVQSIGSAKENEDGTPVFNKRILTLNPDDFDVIIADEGHRFLAPIFKSCLRHFRVYKDEPEFNDPDKLLLVVTATPNRADNKGLGEICDQIVAVRDIRWGIQNKWLCDIEAYKVNTRVDISDVKTTKGDFDNRQLANKINIPARNELVASKFKEIAGGKKAVFFTLDIAHAKDLAAELNKQGVITKALYSGMPNDERFNILKSHREGKIQAITNAFLLCEGYDDPTIECVCMVRPTRSSTMYTQAIGRGLRPFPAPEALAAMRAEGREPDWIKPSCLVIDFVDVSSKHSLITVPTLFGLNANLDMKGQKALETVLKVEEQIAKVPANKQSLVKADQFDDLTKLTGHIEKIDLLSVPSTPDEVKKHSELSWIEGPGGLLLSTPGKTLSVSQNTLGNYSIYSNVKGLQTYVAARDNLQDAIKHAEGLLDDNSYNFAKQAASWKKQPPSAQQVELLLKIDKNSVNMFGGRAGFTDHIMKNFNKSQVSNMITQKLARGK